MRASRENCNRKGLIGRQVGGGEAAGLLSEVGHKRAGGALVYLAQNLHYFILEIILDLIWSSKFLTLHCILKTLL